MNAVRLHFFRAVNLTLLAALVLTANEFLFAFTKPHWLGDLNNTVSWVSSPISLFLWAWFFFAATGLVLCAVASTVSMAHPRVQPLPYAVPAFFLACTLLAVVDNVTYTLLLFSSISHDNKADLLINTVYAVGFLAVWYRCTSMFWRNRTSYRFLESPRIPAVFASLLFIAVFVGVTAWIRFERTLPRVSAEQLKASPNIFLLTVESALADLSSAYIDLPHDTTPFLREFSRESIRFENYFSNGRGTREALNSLVTGLHPYQHLGHTNMDIVPETVADMTLVAALGRNGYSYEILEAEGPRFSEYDENLLFEPVPALFRSLREEWYGVQTILWTAYQRFERIVFNLSWPRALPGPVEVHELAETARRDGRPFFMHVHLLESHGPFTTCTKEDLQRAARDIPWTKDEIELCYLLKLKQADSSARFFYNLLAESGQAENTMFIITGDHPVQPMYITESRKEIKEMLRVPLLIRLPNGERAGEVVRSNVQSIDLVPTILDFMKLPPASWSYGVSALAPGFDAREKLRPILVLHNTWKKVILCDRVWEFHGSNERMPDFSKWPRFAHGSTDCQDDTLPSKESVLSTVRMMWNAPVTLP